MTYPEFSNAIKKGKTLMQLMGKDKCLVLLYELRPRLGHWMCVFQRNKTTIEVFDSLGFFPDAELQFIPRSYRSISGQDHTYLIKALLDSGKKIEYNEQQLQHDDPTINTCGRWVVARIRCRNMSIKKFQFMFRDMNGLLEKDADISRIIL
jgi:Ulp1 family protease